MRFATASGLAVDKADNVFVADFYNHRIQKFSPNGVFLTSFGAKRSDMGQFHHAIAVAVADNGTVFVVDFGNNRVQKWRQAGSQ